MECFTYPAETRSVRRCRLWWVQAEDGQADLQRAHRTYPRLRLPRHEDVRERGDCVPALQAHRSAVRLPGAVSGCGGPAESSLGHRRPLLPVSVGVLFPVRGSEPGRERRVELLLHPHRRYNFILFTSSGFICSKLWFVDRIWWSCWRAWRHAPIIMPFYNSVTCADGFTEPCH